MVGSEQVVGGPNSNSFLFSFVGSRVDKVGREGRKEGEGVFAFITFIHF